LAGLDWKDENVTTVGGYVVRQFGYIPRVGEQVRMDGYIVAIEQADGRRVQQVRVQRLAKAGAPGAVE
jgi:magnesium and cobalt transporter